MPLSPSSAFSGPLPVEPLMLFPSFVPPLPRRMTLQRTTIDLMLMHYLLVHLVLTMHLARNLVLKMYAPYVHQLVILMRWM